MSLIHLEKENFNDLIKKRVLVDFYASWCGPCKMLSPVVEKISKDYEVIKIDIDGHPELAREYGVMSVPTLILFDKELEIKRNIGFLDEKKLVNFINNSK